MLCNSTITAFGVAESASRPPRFAAWRAPGGRHSCTLFLFFCRRHRPQGLSQHSRIVEPDRQGQSTGCGGGAWRWRPSRPPTPPPGTLAAAALGPTSTWSRSIVQASERQRLAALAPLSSLSSPLCLPPTLTTTVLQGGAMLAWAGGLPTGPTGATGATEWAGARSVSQASPQAAVLVFPLWLNAHSCLPTELSSVFKAHFSVDPLAADSSPIRFSAGAPPAAPPSSPSRHRPAHQPAASTGDGIAGGGGAGDAGGGEEGDGEGDGRGQQASMLRSTHLPPVACSAA